MSGQTSRYHRIFGYRNLSITTTTAVMRRQYSDRLCLSLSILLTLYIVWCVLIPSKPSTSRSQRDPTEEQAYTKALRASLPLVQNSNLCHLNEIHLLLLIISSGSHFLERQSIRETWTSIPDAFNIRSQRLFVVGYQQKPNLYKDLFNEGNHEKDLLYLTVDDHSTTLKELHAYRWLEQFCSNVSFIFKTEDDLFINSFLLHEIVRELRTDPNNHQDRYLYNISLDPLFLAHLNPSAQTFLFGWAYQSGTPERNNTASPYYVTFVEYPRPMYPRYCSGFGYLMNAQTRNLLVDEAFKDKHPFRFPDIYITGLLPERLNFVCDVLPYTFHQGTTEQCIKMINKDEKMNNQTEISNLPPIIACSTGLHIGQNAFSDYYKIWQALKHAYADRLQSRKED